MNAAVQNPRLREGLSAVCIDWTFPLAGRGAARDPAPLLEWVRSTPDGMTIHVILPSRLGENIRSLQYTLQSLGCRVTRKNMHAVMIALPKNQAVRRKNGTVSPS